LAYTINTQIIPPWVVNRWGADRLNERAIVEWDVEPAKDRNAEAQTLVTVANAIGVLRDQLRKYDRDVDIVEICNRFGVPVLGDIDGDGIPDAALPTDKIRVSDIDLDKLTQAISLANASGLKPTPDSIANVVRSLGLDVEVNTSLAPAGVAGSVPPSADPAAPVQASEVSNEPLTDEDSKRLAEEMTEHKIEKCQHGSSNRCRLCKVERVRELVKDEAGQPLKDSEGNQLWGVAWRHSQ